MTILQVAEIMLVGWFIIELVRRITLFIYHEWNERTDFKTVQQHKAYIASLPNEEWRPINNGVELIHQRCGTDHLPWEACPADESPITGAYLRRG